MRIAIDYGIDLGTTNSVIACRQGASTALITGPAGEHSLPSVVNFTAAGDLLIGAQAQRLLDDDPRNTVAGFKRLMGTNERLVFPSSGKQLAPEELSALVLKTLVGWARQRGAEDLRAAVITIPAMFQLPQCDATRRAAELADIEHAPLLHEPIAAAVAHSGSGEVREGYWLVYDLGGGTFDVSLVRSKSGRLQVLDHDGDNHLGGRDFDRLLVRKAADLVREAGKLGDFKRSDARWSAAFSRLRVEAERVRIALSTQQAVQFWVDDLLEGSGAEPTGVRFALAVDELETMIAPSVAKTVQLCKRVLSRNNLAPSELNGLVFVGGPTLTPYVARALREDLRVEARHVIDPMQIVALGAALFASTQKLPTSFSKPASGVSQLNVQYESMTTNPTPLLVGKPDPATLPNGARVRVTRGGFDSGLIPISAKGFALDLVLEKGVLNVLRIDVVDGQGRAIPAEPPEIQILHGFSMAKPPLSQSVGVMLADNSVSWYLQRGSTLPARHTARHSTTVALRRGQSGEALNVPLLQGESPRANRNKVIGVLRIYAEQLSRDVPKGAEVEVTVSVDEYSHTVGKAYIPILDQWFEDVVLFKMDMKSAEDVRANLATHKERLAGLESLAKELEGTAVVALDARLEEAAALIDEGDRDGLDVADQMVRWVSHELDVAEEQSRDHKLQKRFRSAVELTLIVIGSYGLDAEKREFEALQHDFKASIQEKDLDDAAMRLDELDDLNSRILTRSPDYWMAMLDNLAKRVTAIGKGTMVTGHYQTGQTAFARRDIHTMLNACVALSELLPAPERATLAIPGISSHLE